jgi:hypothetical protein
MTDNLPPLSGPARKTRRDKNVPRKSWLDVGVDHWRNGTPAERATLIEVVRQIDRMKLPAEKEETKSAE